MTSLKAKNKRVGLRRLYDDISIMSPSLLFIKIWEEEGNLPIVEMRCDILGGVFEQWQATVKLVGGFIFTFKYDPYRLDSIGNHSANNLILNWYNLLLDEMKPKGE